MKPTLKYIYNLIFEQQKYSESKHSIILTLSSAVIVFAATFISNSNIYVLLLSSATIIFSLLAMLYSFSALFSRHFTIKLCKEKSEINLLYYKDIIRFDAETYLKSISKAYALKVSKFDSFELDLSKQIIASSKAVNHKFKCFNYAITLLVLAILCLLICVVIVGAYYG